MMYILAYVSMVYKICIFYRIHSKLLLLTQFCYSTPRSVLMCTNKRTRNKHQHKYRFQPCFGFYCNCQVHLRPNVIKAVTVVCIYRKMCDNTASPEKNCRNSKFKHYNIAKMLYSFFLIFKKILYKYTLFMFFPSVSHTYKHFFQLKTTLFLLS